MPKFGSNFGFSTEGSISVFLSSALGSKPGWAFLRFVSASRQPLKFLDFLLGGAYFVVPGFLFIGSVKQCRVRNRVCLVWWSPCTI